MEDISVTTPPTTHFTPCPSLVAAAPSGGLMPTDGVEALGTFPTFSNQTGFDPALGSGVATHGGFTPGLSSIAAAAPSGGLTPTDDVEALGMFPTLLNQTGFDPALGNGVASHSGFTPCPSSPVKIGSSQNEANQGRSL
jgi:hypothetical protein